MGLLVDKQRARVFYRYLSRVYDTVNPFVWTEEMRAEAIGLLEIDPSDRILDVGCGTGFATEGLVEESTAVHGLDQSHAQLEHAWAKLGKYDPVTFVLGDAERLPYATDTFDVVWSSGSIEYWPHPSTALREFNRVLKPGGAVLVVGPKTPEHPLAAEIANRVMFFYDKERAQQLFVEAGFEEITHTTMGPRDRPDIAIVSVARAP